ncbi:hypothetical protein [Pseudooceanicola nanhaiensis]|uniref:hypothetical protein n=1 Tax=Pseudooceanicola nanhaiensis TaxID=375761 RepID=UPI001CD202B5|nr:hypothetical protein [Pseudooceanicola nanhaiensis]MCA0922599.1 hypothetical protein [Pseudooceanicola nanhaiensis]
MKSIALTTALLLAATSASAQGLPTITKTVPATEVYALREAADIGSPLVPVTTGVVKQTPASEAYSSVRRQRTDFGRFQLITRTVFPAGPADRFNDH